VPFPFVIGRDLVGTALTPAGTFAPGDRVWCNGLGHDGRQGSFAQFAAVPVDRLCPLPAGVDPVRAVAVLHTAGTAHLGLFREARLRAGFLAYASTRHCWVGAQIRPIEEREKLCLP
jgi:NADPH:quinone reductase-like Zn-dependent oxidoreductase